ncbi:MULTISPECIES: FHA domain-containing protein [unclassified Streptomyces]|uniref:FHA domain-containing protein n=1 Tax=unclassified Streptomyces TaxID=2593676 RepID=UPI0022B62A6D|nr:MULTISPECIES: FHA domain-containing protein [unclassified Streptomyces]MCZ7415552.1 FHA domain-containing protein [Streptomyces sp. WMMC897]MCZ7434636.1 FHA domain-containing protein [Streptomyces sp. WMMC1477]
MSFLSKLFGKRKDAGGAHRAPKHGSAGEQSPAAEAERPLFRPEPNAPHGGTSAAMGGVSVDQDTAARIGSQAPSTSTAGGGVGVPICSRCGSRAAESSRFCSNCGAPLRGGAPAGERPSETTSTISISGLEAYDAEATGQTPMLSPEAIAAIDNLPTGSALLVVRRGPNAGARFLLDSELTTAGRSPQSDIFLDDVTVSRRHVEFRRAADGTFTASDVGSLNGTYVNREPIDSVALSNGDEVQIGKFRLVFFAHQRGI